MLPAYLMLVRAGFRRHSTYLAATLAGLFTNTVFGFLRVAVLLAVVAQTGRVVGYDAAAVSAYVWIGQGLLAVVQLWDQGELSERVRSGDIAIDLSRPWNLHLALLAGDLGRAGHALLWRFLPPVALGAVLLPFRWPEQWWTVPLFALSVLLAVLVSEQLRFLMNLTSFWLVDSRGVRAVYNAAGSILSGLTVPLALFPAPVLVVLYATPFPALIQSPTDVFTERDWAAAALGHQLLWVVLLFGISQLALARATRKLVVQGG